MIGYPFGTCLSNECVTCMHRFSLASTLCLESDVEVGNWAAGGLGFFFHRPENGRFS